MADRVIALGKIGAFLDAKVARLQKLTTEGRPRALQEFKKQILATLTKSFNSSTSPTGAGWVPLSAARLAQKKAKSKILIDRGWMRKDAMAGVKAATMAGDMITAILSTGRTKYGTKHQLGKYGVPQRQWYGYNPDNLTAIARVTCQEIIRKLVGKP